MAGFFHRPSLARSSKLTCDMAKSMAIPILGDAALYLPNSPAALQALRMN